MYCWVFSVMLLLFVLPVPSKDVKILNMFPLYLIWFVSIIHLNRWLFHENRNLLSHHFSSNPSPAYSFFRPRYVQPFYHCSFVLKFLHYSSTVISHDFITDLLCIVPKSHCSTPLRNLITFVTSHYLPHPDDSSAKLLNCAFSTQKGILRLIIFHSLWDLLWSFFLLIVCKVNEIVDQWTGFIVTTPGLVIATSQSSALCVDGTWDYIP